MECTQPASRLPISRRGPQSKNGGLEARRSHSMEERSLPELVVQADPRDVHGDAPVRIVEDCRGARKEEARRGVDMTEVLIQIFALDGPVRGEGVFDAATDCPAGLGARAAAAFVAKTVFTGTPVTLVAPPVPGTTQMAQDRVVAVSAEPTLF